MLGEWKSPSSLCACITETVGEAEEAPLLVVKRKIWRQNYTCSKLESYIFIILISTDYIEMTEDNCSLTTEFILIGLTDHPELKTLLFLMFLTIYLIRETLVWWHRYLQSMVFTHECTSFLVTSLWWIPVVPAPLPTKCWRYCPFLRTEWFRSMNAWHNFIFSALLKEQIPFSWQEMAYNRFVAICNPPQYHTMMSKKFCIQMTTGAYIAGNLHSMIHTGFLFRFNLRGSHQIIHFCVCDVLPLYRFSCVDPYTNELMIFISGGSVQTFTITVVIISYQYIIFTIFKKEI